MTRSDQPGPTEQYATSGGVKVVPQLVKQGLGHHEIGNRRHPEERSWPAPHDVVDKELDACWLPVASAVVKTQAFLGPLGPGWGSEAFDCPAEP